MRGKSGFGLVWRVLLLLLAFLVLCYGALEAVVLLGCRDETERDAPVMIVLGAMVWPNGPSPALVRRLDKALDYLDEHPDTQVIVSGGQGANEPESEAQAMADYLIDAGFPASQIHLEDQSTNTRENLLYSMQVLAELGYDRDETPVVVVSNSFHLARVRMLCSRYGIEADTLGAEMPDLKSAFYSYNREVFALVKSFLLDRGEL